MSDEETITYSYSRHTFVGGWKFFWRSFAAAMDSSVRHWSGWLVAAFVFQIIGEIVAASLDAFLRWLF